MHESSKKEFSVVATNPITSDETQNKGATPTAATGGAGAVRMKGSVKDFSDARFHHQQQFADKRLQENVIMNSSCPGSSLLQPVSIDDHNNDCILKFENFNVSFQYLKFNICYRVQGVHELRKPIFVFL